MTVLIDTNIFLELFLDQERADECEDFLTKVSNGEIEGIVTHFSVHAIEAILNDSEAIQRFLRNLLGSIGLEVYSTTVEDEMAASMLMDHVGLDFDDSLQYYVAKKLGVEAIVSFDKHFDGVDVVRKEPSDLL
ncbi:MAG: type II toxin-antitoxin system VapC family toxin [Candidatus Korarchaeota archaeon]|nr:type II toxin-antitoxin system VapC family toxin [Candidatus Korarchaeota archaeon]